MARWTSGKFALRISDRDGMAYPYNEMVQEWTGAWVHQSEYEPKSPLLNPTNHPTDAQSLQHAKPQIVSVIVPLSGISDHNSVTGLNGNTTGVSLGISQNSFDSEMQTISRFNPIPAPGAYETVQVRTMRGLGRTPQANQDTRMISRVGNVTVSIT